MGQTALNEMGMAGSGILKHVDRRAAPRFPIVLPVKVGAAGRVSRHMTIDASTGGLLLRPAIAKVRDGEVITLDVGQVAMGIAAQVVGQRGDKTALRFLHACEGEEIALALSELAQRR